MKKVLIGAAIGITAIYLINKYRKSKSFEEFVDEAKVFKIRAKKQIRNAVDHIHNEAEYIGDRIENEKGKIKRKYSK